MTAEQRSIAGIDVPNDNPNQMKFWDKAQRHIRTQLQNLQERTRRALTQANRANGRNTQTDGVEPSGDLSDVKETTVSATQAGMPLEVHPDVNDHDHDEDQFATDEQGNKTEVEGLQLTMQEKQNILNDLRAMPNTSSQRTMIWPPRGTTERFGTIATALLNLAMDNAHQQPEQNTFTEAELWVRLRFHFSRLILAESATEDEKAQAGERQTMRKIIKQRLQLAEAGEWRFLIMLDRQREVMCNMQTEGK